MFYTDSFMYDVMKISSLPDSLYHYTSIETLALILANKTLRFTRLDGVNDPEEASACDLEKASTLVFASCWTAQAKESLPMWRMYTPNLQGVRIRLPSNPFSGRDKPTVFEKGGAKQILDEELKITRENNGIVLTTRSISGPNKIYYTDDHTYLNGSCLIKEDGEWRIQLHDLGMVKNTYWAFEEEWRFTVLAVIPEVVIQQATSIFNPAFDLVTYPVKNEAIFVPLDKTSFDNMEVLLGPCASSAQEVIVKTLLERYVPSAILKRSEIRVRL